MRSILILFLASIFYIGSVFLVVQGKTFRLDSDYDSNFPIISYVVDTIRSEKRFPLWNPYVTTGISVLGDPLSGVPYVPYLLPMLVFGVPGGWWVVVLLHAFLAGVFMWVLLRKLFGFEDAFWLPLWGGLLYMASGAFAARVAAGHIEKVLSYPWYPLFLLFLLRKSALTGVMAGIMFLTGDVYGLLFVVIFYGVVWVVGEVRGVRAALLAFFTVSAVKLVPFILDVLPVMERFGAFDPLRGSIGAWWSLLPFIVPWGVTFYDRQIFQRLLGFWYNWYEYYAFIGLPVVLLFWLPRAVKKKEVRILLILLAVGLTYVSRGSVYSPWYGLSPIFTWFRVPQRMYGAITSVVVALITVSLSSLKRSLQSKATLFYHLLWVSLIFTFIINGYQMTYAFERPRQAEEAIAREVRARESGEMSYATTVCCMQFFLIREKIRVINYYYGWIPKNVWKNQN